MACLLKMFTKFNNDIYNPMLLCKIVIIYASDITVHSRCIEFRYSSAIEYNTHILMCLHALHIVTNIDI